MTLDDFIKKAETVHGNKYRYDRTVYVDSRTKVCVTCPIHGDFFVLTKNYLRGTGCPECAKERYKRNRTRTNEQFIEDCKRILGDGYTFEKTKYEHSKKKVILTCKKHGDFSKFPCEIYKGKGCPICSKEKAYEENKRSFFEKVREIFGDDYSFDESEYKNSQTKIKCICKKHGEFLKKPNSLLMGSGCPKCWEERRYKNRLSNTEEFIKKAILIHGDLYGYEFVDYIDKETPVKIICTVHGVFEQKPHNHLGGGGCPVCKNSKGELRVRSFLKENGIHFKQQQRFKSNYELCDTKTFVADFFLPDTKTIIEYNGEQHYGEIKFFGGNSKYEKQHERDLFFRQYCKDNNINLIEIPYTEYENIETILKRGLNL